MIETIREPLRGLPDGLEGYVDNTIERSRFTWLDVPLEVAAMICMLMLVIVQLVNINQRSMVELLCSAVLGSCAMHFASRPTRWVVRTVTHMCGADLRGYTCYSGRVCEEETAAAKPGITTAR